MVSGEIGHISWLRTLRLSLVCGAVETCRPLSIDMPHLPVLEGRAPFILHP